MSDLVSIIQERGVESIGRFYSTYRAVVLSNEDPEHCGKILVQIPSVHNIAKWAFPKYNHGGPNTGFKYLSPLPNSIVFVEFENGDPAHPLWSYHGWAVGEIPEELEDNLTLGLVTPSGNKMYLSETDGIINLVTRGGISVKTSIPDDKKDADAEITIRITNEGIKVISKPDITIDCDGDIVFNGGDNLGLIKIEDLTSKLNELVNKVNALVSTYNSHTHICAAAGAASAVPASLAQSANTFNKGDYEDTKIKH